MLALTRSCIRNPALRKGIQMMGVTQPTMQINMKVVPASHGLQNEGYEEKNIRLKREMSPFLTIYKPQLTTMLSISHRGTGFALGTYAWGLGLLSLFSSQDISHYITMIEGLHLAPALVLAAKFVLAFPFGYHASNGIRHLLWDTGRFLRMKEVYATGYAMVVMAFILTGVLTVL